MAKRIILLLIATMLFCSLSKATPVMKEICSKPSPKDKKIVAKVLCHDESYSFCEFDILKGEKWELIEGPDPEVEMSLSWIPSSSCANEVQWSGDGKHLVYWYSQQIDPREPAEGSLPIVKIYNIDSKKLVTFKGEADGRPKPLKHFDKSCAKTICQADTKKNGPFFKIDPKSSTVTFNILYARKGSKLGNGSDGDSCFMWREIEQITFDLKKQKVKSHKSMLIKSGCWG